MVFFVNGGEFGGELNHNACVHPSIVKPKMQPATHTHRNDIELDENRLWIANNNALALHMNGERRKNHTNIVDYTQSIEKKTTMMNERPQRRRRRRRTVSNLNSKLMWNNNE